MCGTLSWLHIIKTEEYPQNSKAMCKVAYFRTPSPRVPQNSKTMCKIAYFCTPSPRFNVGFLSQLQSTRSFQNGRKWCMCCEREKQEHFITCTQTEHPRQHWFGREGMVYVKGDVWNRRIIKNYRHVTINSKRTIICITPIETRKPLSLQSTAIPFN